MKLIRVLLRKTKTPKLKFLLFALLSGVSGVAILAILNHSAEHASNNNVRIMSVVHFALSMGINVLSQKYVWKSSIREVEEVVRDIRDGIFQKIASCNLQSLEKVGKAALHTAISQHTYTISVASTSVMASVQNVIIIFFSLAYLAWLSMIAFVLTVLFIGIVGYVSSRRSNRTNVFLDAAIQSEQKVFYSLSNLLEGFQEVKLNDSRKEGILSDAADLSESARHNRVLANEAMATDFIGTQLAFFFLLAILVFLVPNLSLEAYPDTVVKIATVGLFMMGPLTSIVSLLPHISNADHSYQLIENSEKALDEAREMARKARDGFPEFEQLELMNIEHHYIDDYGDSGFSIGPLSLSVSAKEIIFISGGNGSGKSTLIKILSGLYNPNSGTIKLNGTKIDDSNLLTYRSQFAAVLSDYHLFPECYGMRNLDKDRVDRLLEQMGLKEKTEFVDGKFDTIKLSTGQKKRLALIVSILEDRPIMVFDEWAADQDPEFRRIFYQEILPQLKSEGKTVIAVTHDERYLDTADRRYHMEEGLLNELKDTGSPEV